jgi:hypothetical protein
MAITMFGITNALSIVTSEETTRAGNIPFIWKACPKFNSLKEVGGKLIYSRSNQNPRTCILVKKVFQILSLMHYCPRDLMAVKIKSCGRGPRKIILRSAYLPYDDLEPPPPQGVGEAGGRMQSWWQDAELVDLTLSSAVMQKRITQPGGVLTLTEVSLSLILLRQMIWT